MKKNLSLFMGLIVINTLIGCAAQNQLPPENNPIIIGGYTAPLKFNWLQDNNISENDRRIKVLMAVAKQNQNNQIVVFYGKSCTNLGKRINQIFSTQGFKTYPVKNTDPQKQDITYVYINFAPIDDSDVFGTPTESSSIQMLSKKGIY